MEGLYNRQRVPVKYRNWVINRRNVAARPPLPVCRRRAFTPGRRRALLPGVDVNAAQTDPSPPVKYSILFITPSLSSGDLFTQYSLYGICTSQVDIMIESLTENLLPYSLRIKSFFCLYLGYEKYLAYILGLHYLSLSSYFILVDFPQCKVLNSFWLIITIQGAFQSHYPLDKLR